MPQILTEYEFVTPYAQNKTNQPQVIGLITTILPGHMFRDYQAVYARALAGSA